MGHQRLLEGVDAALRRADHTAARQSLERLMAALLEAPDEAVALAAAGREVRLSVALGRYAVARRRAEAAVGRARIHGDAGCLGSLLVALGEACLTTDDIGLAAVALEQAVQLLRAGEDRARAELGLARVALQQGNLTACEERVAAAVRGFDEVGRTEEGALALFVAARCRQQSGDVRGADALVRASQGRLEDAADPRLRAVVAHEVARLAVAAGRVDAAGVAARRGLAKLTDAHAALQGRLWVVIGDADRVSADLDGALEAYRRAAEHFEAAGHDGVLVPQAREAAVLVQQGRTAVARSRLQPLVERCEALERAVPLLVLHALMLPCAAAARDWSAWSWHHARASALAGAGTGVQREAADAARRAGEMLEGSKSEDALLSRAVRAWALARRLYTALGLVPESEASLAALAALGRRGAPVPAGPFDLKEPVGHGAMGEVWRAVHHDRGTVVAVKVVLPAQRDDGRFARMIDSEVRAVGALDHPNIVRVLGTGSIGPSAAAVSHGQVGVGSPWFAMEYADGGTLEALCGVLPWCDVRAILLGLMDALAHAHARGVVHLDLKPANVLVNERPDGARDVLLTDFGLARLAHAGAEHGASGTPKYMAPEQFAGDSREFGPWTDLYGLGCLAVHLVQGTPAYSGESFEAQRLAHQSRALPEITPRCMVPAGLSGWLAGLLAREPRDRMQHAADAARALLALGPSVGSADAPEPLRFAPTSVALSTAPGVPGAGPAGLPASGSPCGLARVPPTWRSAAVAPWRHDLVDEALSLFGLRPAPMVGREGERDRLWAALGAVADHGEPRLFEIAGGSGTGRSALTRWMVRRCAELGVASGLDAGAGADGGIGLASAVARFLRLDGLEHGIAEVRIRAMFPGLSRLVARDLAVLGTERGVAMQADDQVAAVHRLVAELAAVRPVVLRMERTSGEDPTSLAAGLVAAGVPVLILLETDGAPPRLQSAEVIHLAPMGPGALGALLDHSVPMEPRLREALVRRSAGHPDYALHLLGLLVQRRALVLTTDGWALRPGFAPTQPPALARRWSLRLDQAALRLDPFARAAVAGAALLRRAVTAAEWQTVCRVAEVDGERVLAGLAWAALAAESPDGGLVFAHPAAADLVRDAWGGKLAARCAVAALPVDADHALRADLLSRAGEGAQAAVPLLHAARDALDHEEPRVALRHLEDRLQALRAAGRGPDLADRLIRTRLALLTGDPVAPALASEAAQLVTDETPYTEAAECGLLRALAVGRRGDPEEARTLLRAALDAYADLRDPVGQARALLAAAAVSRRDGEGDRGAALLRRALSRLDGGEAPGLQARVRAALGRAFVEEGQLPAAEEELLLSLHLADEAGSASAGAEALAGLGDLARRRGALDAALARYQAALERLPWQHALRGRVDVGRALALLAGSRWAEASAVVDALVGRTRALDRGEAARWAQLLLLPLRVRASARTWRPLVSRAERLLADPALQHRDAAWTAEVAGLRACALGRPDRAGHPWRLAARVYEQVGADEDVERVDRARRALAAP